MLKHLQYLKYLIRHKIFVFIASRDLGVSLFRACIHDWTKFLPHEWFAYTHSFYGKQPRRTEVKEEFNRAWLHHIHFNKHHWQHWILRLDSGGEKILLIPDKYVREMVADWMGAGRAITGKWDIKEWYTHNKETIRLHPDSRDLVEKLIFQVSEV